MRNEFKNVKLATLKVVNRGRTNKDGEKLKTLFLYWEQTGRILEQSVPVGTKIEEGKEVEADITIGAKRADGKYYEIVELH